MIVISQTAEEKNPRERVVVLVFIGVPVIFVIFCSNDVLERGVSVRGIVVHYAGFSPFFPSADLPCSVASEYVCTVKINATFSRV